MYQQVAPIEIYVKQKQQTKQTNYNNHALLEGVAGWEVHWHPLKRGYCVKLGIGVNRLNVSLTKGGKVITETVSPSQL